jgi:TPR repeat protein
MKKVLIAIIICISGIRVLADCDMMQAKGALLKLEHARARQMLEACHQAGNTEATSLLGLTYIINYMGDVQPEKAKLLFDEAIGQGDGRAFLGLGYYYWEIERLDSVIPNFEKAIPFLEKEYDEKDVFWSTRLAFVLGLSEGTSFYDEQRATSILKNLLPSDYAILNHNIGVRNMEGAGMEVNYDSAEYYFTKAYENGYHESKWGFNDLSKYYFRGTNTELDLHEAKRLAEIAFDKGVDASVVLLGMTDFYLNSPQKAIAYLEEQSQVHEEAKYPLAFCYMNSPEANYQRASEILEDLGSGEVI